jgi:hypothetical protein
MLLQAPLCQRIDNTQDISKKKNQESVVRVMSLACALQASSISRAKKAGVSVHSAVRRDILALWG